VSIRTFSKRRVAIIGATTAIALAGGGAAFAYFTATGSGTGSGTVGSTANWSVTAGAGTYGSAGALFPCGTTTAPSPACTADEETIVFTIKNTGKGAQELQTAVPAIASDSSTPSDIETGGTNNGSGLTGDTPVTGCLASWFGASDATAFTPVDVAAGSTTTVTVTVTMEDSGSVQNPCETTAPDVTLNVT
jgi:hypothetical protein